MVESLNRRKRKQAQGRKGEFLSLFSYLQFYIPSRKIGLLGLCRPFRLKPLLKSGRKKCVNEITRE
jgi:hypothetical protein